MFNKFLLMIFLSVTTYNFILSENISSETSLKSNAQDNEMNLQSNKSNLIAMYVCCEPDQVFYQNECQKNLTNGLDNKITVPQIYRNPSQVSNKSSDDLFYFKLWIPCRNNMNRYITTMDIYNNFFLLENGSIFESYHVTKYSSYDTWTNTDRYCLTNEFNKTAQNITAAILWCNDFPDKNPVESKVDAIRAIGELLSAPFFGITFIVYAILPELHSNVHGKTVMTYVGCLFVTFSLFAVIEFNEAIYNHLTLCTTLAFTIYFSVMSSFFWLNVMSFDIFSTFRGTLSSRLNNSSRKFAFYSLYAWGCSSMLTLLCLTMDFYPHVPKSMIRPGMYTWFTSWASESLYFYLPLALTVCVNIGLFISTARKIRQLKQETSDQLKGTDSCRHDDNEHRFGLYLKLFLIMGVNWTAEILSWLLQFLQIFDFLWYITDIANSLQGLTVFIIFVCTKKVKNLLVKRFCKSSRCVHDYSVSRSSESSMIQRSNANSSTKSTTKSTNIQTSNL